MYQYEQPIKDSKKKAMALASNTPKDLMDVPRIMVPKHRDSLVTHHHHRRQKRVSSTGRREKLSRHSVGVVVADDSGYVALDRSTPSAEELNSLPSIKRKRKVRVPQSRTVSYEHEGHRNRNEGNHRLTHVSSSDSLQSFRVRKPSGALQPPPSPPRRRSDSLPSSLGEANEAPLSTLAFVSQKFWSMIAPEPPMTREKPKKDEIQLAKAEDNPGQKSKSPRSSRERTPRESPERTPKGSPERTPKGSSERAPKRTPERAPKGSPERTSKGSPERTPKGSPESEPRNSPTSKPKEKSPSSKPKGKSPTSKPKERSKERSPVEGRKNPLQPISERQVLKEPKRQRSPESSPELKPQAPASPPKNMDLSQLPVISPPHAADRSRQVSAPVYAHERSLSQNLPPPPLAPFSRSPSPPSKRRSVPATTSGRAPPPIEPHRVNAQKRAPPSKRPVPASTTNAVTGERRHSQQPYPLPPQNVPRAPPSPSRSMHSTSTSVSSLMSETSSSSATSSTDSALLPASLSSLKKITIQHPHLTKADVQLIQSLVMFAKVGTIPAGSSPIPKLVLPVAIPQLGNGSRVPFSRAIAQGLQSQRIMAEQLLTFIDHLNIAMSSYDPNQADVKYYSSEDAAKKEAYEFSPPDCGRQVSKARKALFLHLCNALFFKPRGLEAKIVDAATLAPLLGYESADDVLVPPVQPTHVALTVHERRMLSMKGRAVKLTFDVPAYHEVQTQNGLICDKRDGQSGCRYYFPSDIDTAGEYIGVAKAAADFVNWQSQEEYNRLLEDRLRLVQKQPWFDSSMSLAQEQQDELENRNSRLSMVWNSQMSEQSRLQVKADKKKHRSIVKLNEARQKEIKKLDKQFAKGKKVIDKENRKTTERLSRMMKEELDRHESSVREAADFVGAYGSEGAESRFQKEKQKILERFEEAMSQEMTRYDRELQQLKRDYNVDYTDYDKVYNEGLKMFDEAWNRDMKRSDKDRTRDGEREALAGAKWLVIDNIN
ncbi:hypothetical protein TRVA0_075S00452 [Trichomonascus vanleenenianus]|uniref:uncharacterized protein n=1 Tax=Trichomonascus vanleenenianus TaxID=2268995 RepID=UPI003ECB86F2